MNNRGKVFIFSAPSGAGKTTIVHRILSEFKDFAFSVSATTRPRRAHEIDGKDYHFLNQEEFRRRRDAGEFLEWEEVYPGRFYGTLKQDVEEMLDSGKCVVFDVDVKGGQAVKRYFGDQAVAFFIQPPSLEVLRERLESRATDSREDIEKRLAKAGEELKDRVHFDRIVVNDQLETAVAEVRAAIAEFLQIA